MSPSGNFSFLWMVKGSSWPELISLVASFKNSIHQFNFLPNLRERKKQGQEKVHLHDVICYLMLCVFIVFFIVLIMAVVTTKFPTSETLNSLMHSVSSGLCFKWGDRGVNSNLHVRCTCSDILV